MTDSDKKPSYDELVAKCARLETESGRRLVVQNDLIRAKDQVDEELARFQTFQRYIAAGLKTETEDEFHNLTLETLIEAFEVEVALFLRIDAAGERLDVLGQFGFEDVPESLPFDPDWFTGPGSRVAEIGDEMLAGWGELPLKQAIACPFHDENQSVAGIIVAGVTHDGSGYYTEPTEALASAFTVMVGQAATMLNIRSLNGELFQQNTRLEKEVGQHIVTQQGLIVAKRQVDEELTRFQAIQRYISGALDSDSETEFTTRTLEAIIEAFELEVAVFLRHMPDSGTLAVVDQFGFEDVPENLPHDASWFASDESRIVAADDPALEAWSDLGFSEAILCPYHDKNGAFAGAIAAGVTAAGADFFEPLSGTQLPAFTVMVQQAGALFINRQLNAEILEHNRALASLTDSYSRFVPFQFLELLGRSTIQEIDTGDSTALDMSVLFVDIRGFTALSERLGPADIFASLNAFLEVVEPLVTGAGGFINQYLGDAVMALFPEDADAALACATAITDAAGPFNADRVAAGEMPINFGLGINSGPLMLGALGGGKRLDSNVIGDTANLASRTEGLTRQYGVEALCTEHTLVRLQQPDAVDLRELDRVVVKGRAAPVSIYELLACDTDASAAQKRATREAFAAALTLYRDGDFAAARDGFAACTEQAPDDNVAALYIARCQGLIDTPPDGDWQGVWVLDSK
ncbi:MAG: adenylate/guanylate cyclase domain-containing protein [Alphaproteobacteria bacterium]